VISPPRQERGTPGVRIGELLARRYSLVVQAK